MRSWNFFRIHALTKTMIKNISAQIYVLRVNKPR
uniref:Uncharacterized protein n=1 Tax=Arundo donax TaxID=35708 RepID=A0A0A9FG94_ARUDO